MEPSFTVRYQTQVARFHELLEKLAKQQLALNEIKQLRVTTRRLRAFVWVLDRFFDDETLDTTSVELKELGHQLGKIRRLDAALEDAGRYELDPGTLGADRKKELADLLKSYREAKISHLESDVHSMEPFFEKLPPDYERQVLKKVVRRLHKLDKSHPHSAKDFHQIRISGKKMRYVLEALGKDVEALKGMQQYLGKMNDLYTLKEITGNSDKLKKDFKKLKKGAKKLFRKKLEETSQNLA